MTSTGQHAWHAPIGAIAATAAVVALLVAFVQVLRGAVTDGESYRRSVAERADATWRCRLLSAASTRKLCLAQLPPTAPGR